MHKKYLLLATEIFERFISTKQFYSDCPEKLAIKLKEEIETLINHFTGLIDMPKQYKVMGMELPDESKGEIEASEKGIVDLYNLLKKHKFDIDSLQILERTNFLYCVEQLSQSGN